MNRHASIAALLCASLVSACGPSALQDITIAPPAASRIRFFNFGVNAPGVNFYSDATKMTAILSSTGVESTNGIAYGGVSANGDYLAIDPGSHTFTGKIAATTDKDLAIATLTTTIADGVFYSLYLSGFYNTTAKSIESFIVDDTFTIPADVTTTSVRFVNAISNSSPMILYAKNQTTLVETAIGGAVAYKAAGAFTTLPPGVYDLNTRLAGSSTNLIPRTSVGLIGGRVYTITARGDITVAPSTTACGSTNRTCLDNTANY